MPFYAKCHSLLRTNEEYEKLSQIAHLNNKNASSHQFQLSRYSNKVFRIVSRALRGRVARIRNAGKALNCAHLPDRLQHFLFYVYVPSIMFSGGVITCYG